MFLEALAFEIRQDDEINRMNVDKRDSPLFVDVIVQQENLQTVRKGAGIKPKIRNSNTIFGGNNDNSLEIVS